MKSLDINELAAYHGGFLNSWQKGFLCAASITGAALLLSNPVTFTAGVYAASVAVGSGIGACAGSFVYD